VDRVKAGSYDSGMPVCGRCGEENPERARFCLGCAAPLAASPVARRDERKRVSVLFCDLVGFTSRSERLDVEDVRAVLAPYYARLRADLERYGGTVEKFIGDAVMALFGAPIAHEDDPERAVRAALAIREAITELNQADPALDLHVRIGVTTGEALVTLDAQPREGEGMASGDVVNTAARLQAVAPVDGILVDEATFRATDRQITYQPAEPVQAKGKADPVAVWLAVEARASLGVDVEQAPQTALVGRQRELDLLGAALARARDEHALQLITLVGVPGMGKSRLVWELKELVEAEPELTIWRQGRCLPYGEGVALWALGEIVKAQAGILETDAAELATAKLDQAIADLVAEDGEAAWVTGQLRPLVGLAAAGEAGGDPRAEAFTAWRRFLEALAERGPAVQRCRQVRHAIAEAWIIQRQVLFAAGPPQVDIARLLVEDPLSDGGSAVVLLQSKSRVASSHTSSPSVSASRKLLSGLWRHQYVASCATHFERAASGEASRMKNLELASACSIEGHRPGFAERLASSRNTRSARRRYQGLVKRCSAVCSAGASRPSRARL
jgi:class 3 adenylate cyclase